MSENVLSVLTVFSSRSFIVSGLTFRFLIHFEFILVYGVSKCSSFILLHMVVVLVLIVASGHAYRFLRSTSLFNSNTLFPSSPF